MVKWFWKGVVVYLLASLTTSLLTILILAGTLFFGNVFDKSVLGFDQWDLNCKEVQSTKPNSVNRQSWNVKVEVERWEIWRESWDMEYFVLHPSQFHFSQSISFMGSVDSLLEIAAIRYNSDLFSCSQSKTGHGYVVLFIYYILEYLNKPNYEDVHACEFYAAIPDNFLLLPTRLL